MTIDEINIGSIFIGATKGKGFNTYANLKAEVKDKTLNSIQLYITAVSKEGISSYQWLRIEDFNKEFSIYS